MTESPTVRELGELRLIREILAPRFDTPSKAVGIGDDCALLPLGDGRSLAASTDRVPGDFLALERGAIDHRTLGRYVVALNLSDLAASGARPLGMLVTLALPSDLALDSLIALADGIADGSRRFGCPVVGGDTSDAAELGVAATALGLVDSSQALLRSGARPGDHVFVSRLPGAGAAVLRLLTDERLRESFEGWATTCHRHFAAIAPALDLSVRLVESGACTSCIDNTDGLATSLHHLARASGVGIRIEASFPLDPLAERVFGSGDAARLLALGAGVDLGLVGTIDPASPLASEASGALLTIGVVEDGKGVGYVASDGARCPVEMQGWEYFSAG